MIRVWLAAGAVVAVVWGCGDDGAGGVETGEPPVQESSDAAARGDDAGSESGDAGSTDGGASPVRELSPIDPPVADDCITEVSAGDHTFTCNGLTFLVMVDPVCTTHACGLILDVHGGTMAGAQMRDNTQLHELAPAQGFLVVHPSSTSANTGGLWTAANYPDVADFMLRMIAAFHVDERRVHFTGFSQGGMMSWDFVCNQNEVLASAAPVAATPSCVDDSWSPKLSLLYMQGVTDGAFTIESSRTMVEGLKGVFGVTDGVEDGDGHFTRTRFESDEGLSLVYIEHDYGGQAVLGGHCIPGGVDISGAPNNFGLNATTCTEGQIDLHWGETVLQFFLDNPRR